MVSHCRQNRSSNNKRQKLIQIDDDDPKNSYRDWLSLPDDLLRSIVGHLFVSYRDALAFSAVCTAWRSLAGPLPPVLLHFDPWARSAPAHIKTLTDSSSFESKLPIYHLWYKACVGYSHRHLIFAARDVIVIDVFTGVSYSAPRLPLNYSRFDIAILTSPPTDLASKILLLDWSLTDLLYTGGGTYHWSVLRLDGVSDPKIRSLCSADNTSSCRVYGLLSAGRVVVIDTNDMSWELLEGVELPKDDASNTVLYSHKDAKAEHVLKLNQNLVQCDGELFLILMVGSKGGETEWVFENMECRLAAIKTYRLHFVRRTWVEVEGIGDWCLFMDVVGKGSRVTPCREPSRWGLRSNCIYVAGGRDAWRVIPTDGTAFSHGFLCPSRWPSPIWVHPTDSSSSNNKRPKLILIDDDPKNNYRNWLSFPDNLLRSIVGRVFISYRDALAFSGACSSWRSLVGPFPPLLLHFDLCAHSSTAHLKTLTDSSRFESKLPIQLLWDKACVGYSHRHLIFTTWEVLLFDVFTGYWFTINHSLPLNYSRFDIAILTAPPTYPGGKLLLLDWSLTDLLYIGGNDDHWSVLRLDGVSDPKILSLCSADNTSCIKVYGLLSAGRVFVIDTSDMSWELLEGVELPDDASNAVLYSYKDTKVEHILQLNRNLVQCNGELMLVLMVGSKGGETEWRCRREWRMAAIKLYRLDFVRRAWVEAEGIGDLCLFMDVVGKGSRVAPCGDPLRWGLKSNCIYVAGGRDTWREIPADGTPFGHGFICTSRWPSPIWVRPTD